MNTEATSPPQVLSSASRSSALVTLTILAFVVAVNVSAMTPLLPQFTRDFELSVSQTSWVFTALFLAGGVTTVLLPRMGDVFGDRLVVILCPIIVAAGCLLIAASNSYALLILGVVCLGVATSAPAVTIASGRRLIGDNGLGRVVAFVSGAGMIGGAIGQLLGGWAAAHMTLSTYFYILAAGAIAVTGAVAVVIPRTRPSERGQLGILSLALLVAWVVIILLGVSNSSNWGLLSTKTLSVIGFGLALAVAWAMRERRQATPVVDFKLFQHSRFRYAIIAALALGMPLSGIGLLVPMITQLPESVGGLAMAPLGTAAVMFPYAACAALGNTIAARAITLGSPLTIASVGAVFHACGALWLGFSHYTIADFVIGTFIYGLGVGMVLGGLQGSVQRSVPAERAGMAAGTLGLCIAASGAIGAVLFSLVIGRESITGAPGVPTDQMFIDAFIISALCEVVVLTFCVLGARSERKDRARSRIEDAA